MTPQSDSKKPATASTPIPVSETTFVQMMTLENHGPDTFVGPSYKYRWGIRLFGGQVVAQALRAAQHTVGEDFRVHSIHSYFIRPGSHDEPIRFEVDRIRNGRSFCTRRVVARQSGGAILNLSASFQTVEDSADIQRASMPEVAPPDELPEEGWGTMLLRRRSSESPGRVRTWMRLDADIDPDDHHLQTCGFLFVSDGYPMGTVRTLHPLAQGRPESGELFVGASLDHVVYFQRPVVATQWHLADMRCDSFNGARGVATGPVFAANGTHIATVIQEALLRERRT